MRIRALAAGAVAALVVLGGCAVSGPARQAGPSSTSAATTSTTSVTVPSSPSSSSSTTTSTVPSTTTSTRPPTTSPSSTTVGPPSTAPAGRVEVISKGSTSRPVVALTFDAGSDVGYTTQILDVLAAHHIPATFGITGVWAQANPALLRRIAAAGHQIVDHTWDHQSFTGTSTDAGALGGVQIAQELQRADTLIRQLTGAGTAGWFRPPYGDRGAASDAAAAAAGYRYELMWTVDTLGWKGVAPQTVVQRALSALVPGEIVLMHVGSASTDSSALPALIAALEARGYGFVTASALV